MSKASELNNGKVIRFNGERFQIFEWIHRTPGNLRAFYQARMRNLKTGKIAEYRFRVDEEVEIVRIETKDMQYLYDEGDALVCMDATTFDQVSIPKEFFCEAIQFMKEQMNVVVNFEGDQIISAEPPTFVELEVTYSEPGIKGDTVNNVMKPATLETGAQIKVPMFVDVGDKVRIDTRTGEYMDRIRK